MNKLQVDLGEIIVSPDARDAMVAQGVQTSTILQQHIDDNWENDTDPTDEEDEFQVSRMMSSQKVPKGELWVITEFDRHMTTITLPCEPED